MAGIPKFDREAVLFNAAETFAARGYEGASVTHLVAATGLQRGSLYGAFASKAGLFKAAFEAVTKRSTQDDLLLDLLIVALRERCASDPRVAELAKETLSSFERTTVPVEQQIYRRLLSRAGLEPTSNVTDHRERKAHG